MRMIKISEFIKTLHKKYWEDNICPQIDEEIKHYTLRNEALKQYLEYCKMYWETLAVGDVNMLRQFENDLERDINVNMENLDKKEKKRIYKCFGYASFSKKTSNENQIQKAVEMFASCDYKNLRRVKWAPYIFVFLLPIRTCPYCNRQYITPICKDKTDKTDSKKLRADLEHFWPKSKYPHFSMSLYNLVPSCKFCNSSLKGQREFAFYMPTPYECSYDDYFHFEIDYGDFNVSSINIETIIDDEKVQPIIDMFAIEDLYAYHSNVAKEMVQKRLCYSDVLLKDILNLFNNVNLYENEEELKAVLLGFPFSKEKILDEPLGKLRYDLATRLGFIR